MKFKEFNYKTLYERLFVEFLNKSSIHGLRLFLMHSPVRYAKTLWIILMATVVIWTHFIIVRLTFDFLEQPTEVHMSTDLVHVANSPFPGVAICSANKINKTKLMQFAENVFQKQQAYSPNLLVNDVESMAKDLLIMANFYIYPFDEPLLNQDRLEKLHNILTYMYNATDYPTREILRDLAPDCRKLINRGLVFGAPIDISKLFMKRLTSTSVCCTFNYKRRSASNDPSVVEKDNNAIRNAPEIKFQANSILNSVQFVLQSNVEEFTYKEFANNAFQLYIFPPHDFATLQSTKVGEIFVDHSSIVEIPIQPKFFEANAAVRQFSPKLRQCYFPEEGQQLLNQSYYSIDECLLYCRMESMTKHCGCVTPPMYAMNINVSYCTLLDLPCLMRWKSVWYNWNYFDYVSERNANLEEQNYLKTYERCGHCLPTCNGVDFQIIVNTFPLRKSTEKFYDKGLLKGLSNEKPLSIIKLYYQKRFAEATEMNIVGDWVVLLNRFGGIMSFMYGFSLISYIEILYFVTGKWFFNIYLALELKLKRKLSSISLRRAADRTPEPQQYELYWDELSPKGVKA